MSSRPTSLNITPGPMSNSRTSARIQPRRLSISMQQGDSVPMSPSRMYFLRDSDGYPSDSDGNLHVHCPDPDRGFFTTAHLPGNAAVPALSPHEAGPHTQAPSGVHYGNYETMGRPGGVDFSSYQSQNTETPLFWGIPSNVYGDAIVSPSVSPRTNDGISGDFQALASNLLSVPPAHLSVPLPSRHRSRGSVEHHTAATTVVCVHNPPCRDLSVHHGTSNLALDGTNQGASFDHANGSYTGESTPYSSQDDNHLLYTYDPSTTSPGPYSFQPPMTRRGGYEVPPSTGLSTHSRTQSTETAHRRFSPYNSRATLPNSPGGSLSIVDASSPAIPNITMPELLFTTAPLHLRKAMRYLLRSVRGSPFFIENTLEPIVGSEEANRMLNDVRSGTGVWLGDGVRPGDSLYEVFIEPNEKRNYINGVVKKSRGRVLGNVRSFLGHRPFACGGAATGCKSRRCERSDGPLRFFTQDHLKDHMNGQIQRVQCIYTNCGRLIHQGGMRRHWRAAHAESQFPHNVYPNYGGDEER